MPYQTNAAGRTVVVVLLGATVYAIGHALRHTTSCFLLSFVIAYLLDPLVAYLEGKKLSRTHSIIVVYVALTVVSFFATAVLVPLVTSQWQAMIPSLPMYVKKAKALGLEIQGRFYGAEEWRWLYDQAMDNVDQVVSQMGTLAYSAAASVVFNIFNVVLAPILVFFMLHYKEKIKETAAGFLPAKQRSAVIHLGNEINESIGGYLRGQVIVSAIVAILSSAALMALDVDYPIFNGIFAGVASVLPFIGVIIATIPPLFFAYLKFQSALALVKVVVCFAVIYFLEGYLVKPLVFRRSMDLNPLLTIIMVMALGELFGFWGIILAIPVAAALKLLSEAWKRGDFKAMGSEQ
ncbi:AI-2E family transporter [Geomesophilobacter sediminis]|uniref:AI-2E family transporter n=1 Tax=Geomesophilobacter sediminis TaxID=2798584 RepID=A0A8J7M0Z3_9BACT|nr:AI-2E family transporter [Geomesophilobacter sediminis]MBJ6726604.1 AI-2E family transporter [Geomesophilobacter sediminis]